MQRPSRGTEEHARVAEEVRGALAQALGRPKVIEDQEAAGGEGQVPAVLVVVHSGGGSGPDAASAVRRQRRTQLNQRPLALSAWPPSHPCLDRSCVTSPAGPAPSDQSEELVGGPSRGTTSTSPGFGGRASRSLGRGRRRGRPAPVVIGTVFPNSE